MSDSDDDWFNKDENEIVESLQQQVKLKQQLNNNDLREEAIHITHSAVKKLLLIDDTGRESTNVRFTTGDLANALKMSSLEMFLYFMSDDRDLFADQMSANDSQKRLLQYVTILTRLCQMELGGFGERFVSGFAKQIILFKHIKVFALKLFQPPSKGILDADSALMLRSIKYLLLRAHKLGALDQPGYDLIEHLKTLISRCKLTNLLKHPLCVELVQALEDLPPMVDNIKHMIYPTLEDILEPTPVQKLSVSSPAPKDAARYIDWQRKILCEDFVQPLQEFVKRVREKRNIDSLVEEGLLYPRTELVLNPDFAEAERHDLIFMVIHTAAGKPREILKNFKTGSMLCFTTSYDFDNLVLAIVKFTDKDKLKMGYLSVEIVKQYNIGNIYDKTFIMFETPVFFEPYLRVHNYLSTCSADDFPMRQYIIDGCTSPTTPKYIAKCARLSFDCKPFVVDSPSLHLNQMQKSAFTAALHSDLCLIQGPPGTGKTHLSVQILNMLIQNAAELKSGPIILLTYTNDSLDKFLLQMSKYTDSILRFGSRSRLPEIERFNVRQMVDVELVPPRLKRVWWLVKCEYKEQFQRLQAMHADFDGTEEDYQSICRAQEKLLLIDEKIATLRTIFQYYVARDKALLAMTTTCGARLNFLFRLLQSKCFIFEEAAETTEAHVMACLTPNTEHVILVGDHKQLQPYAGNYKYQGLQVSLFERLINHQFPVSVLQLQYRMRPCIAQLLVPLFYDRLESDDSVLKYPNIKDMPANLYFINHCEPEEQLSDMSYVNKYEAQTAKKLVDILISENYKDIVILTPYNAQVQCIQERIFGKKIRSRVSVATVDSFQGLEANVVILSLVRSNEAGQIGFLRLPNRVCVALSRARWALYIIGNMETLMHGNQELWGAINEKLKAQNAIGVAYV